MTQDNHKNKVFTDYAAIVHALVPAASGLLFHNHVGKLFWRDADIDNTVLTEAYKSALQNLLLSRAYDPMSCRIMMGDWAAYLLPIINENANLLGAMTILLPSDAADLPYQKCKQILAPAISALGRELILRRNLTELKNAASLSENDHSFLRELPIKARHKDGHEAAIDSILSATVNYLNLSGATLLVPERPLQASVGKNPLAFGDARKILKQLTAYNAVSESQLEAAHDGGMEIAGLSDVRAWPVFDDKHKLIGLLALSWPGKISSMSERAIGLAGFLITTVELVLERAFDPLTGLLNWPAFETSLASAYDEKDTEWTLMYLDIDQLHVLNDTFGRKTGDEVMVRFANLLREMLPGQTITRITGDGFAVLIEDMDLDKTAELASGICAKFREIEYTENGKSLRPTVSIGVSYLVRGDDGVRGALIPAQISCQAAKDRGRNRVDIHRSGDSSIVQRIDDLHMIGAVRNAIQDNRLTLFAQPVVRLDGDLTRTYHEVLVRMLDDNGNAVKPDEFLGAAGRYQLMQELDEWVVSNAIRALVRHDTLASQPPLQLAINLSGQSVGNEQFLEFLKAELRRPDVPARRLCFEVTESIAVQNADKAAGFMEEIKAFGCEFALDDFGIGHSSFGYLKRFPINKLKIDGSFVADICENPVSRVMVKAIADIARVMQIETVAEYVQDEGVLEAIREIGLDWAQGYLVGAPVQLNDLLGENESETAHSDTDTSNLPI